MAALRGQKKIRHCNCSTSESHIYLTQLTIHFCNSRQDWRCTSTLPQGARDLGGGYVLLTATDSVSRPMRACEKVAVGDYIEGVGGDYRPVFVKRWARVRLPNGQIARTLRKESSKPLSKSRMSRNVKVS